MDDIVLVTADSVRYDYLDSMPFVTSHNPLLGITTGHFTRPSLAGLHSSTFAAVIQSRIVGRPIAQVLNDAGYSCIGLAPSAQADPAFDFDAGFDHFQNFSEGAGNVFENRRSPIREFLGGFDLVRDIYYRLFPMEAILSDLPSDDEVVDLAIDQFNSASPPRFLWVHLMESHRPYGRGDDALPKELDRKAGAGGAGSVLGPSNPTPEERATIRSYYRKGLERTDDRIARLWDGLDSEPLFVFTSDHGDELGEEGFYYHQGYRRRVVDPIIQVPVVLDGFDLVGDRLSHIDIAPTIASEVGAKIPGDWQGFDLSRKHRDETLTVAPWHGRATVAWQDFDRKIVAADADVTFESDAGRIAVERADVSSDIQERLRNLGYHDAG